MAMTAKQKASNLARVYVYVYICSYDLPPERNIYKYVSKNAMSQACMADDVLIKIRVHV